MNVLILLVLFVGEALVIWAEMIGASAYASGATFWKAFLYTTPALVVGSLFLVISYILGLKQFSNIWVITAVSLGSILIVEPLFNFFYIGQAPTLGSGVGFALGVLGILASLFL